MNHDITAREGAIVYYVAQSLDGYIADRNDELDWLLAFGMSDFDEQYASFMRTVGAIVMGAGTYRWLQASGEPWPYAGLTTWVLTHGTLPPYPSSDDVRTANDVRAVAAAAREAAGSRSVWLVGGGATAAQFADAGLLDELRITVMPVTLGAGAALLPHGEPARRWTLASTRPLGEAVELVYRSRPL